MDLKLKILEDTVFKQKPISSDEISDPEGKQTVQEGTEIKLSSWRKAENSHIKISCKDPDFHGKDTWYAFTDHVEIFCNGQKIPLQESKHVGEVTSCSTHVVRELDQQILDKMNELVPNVLVSFESFNVELGAAVWPLVQPSAKRALEKAIKDRGQELSVNSAYRTIAQQQILYNHYKANHRCGYSLVAPPPRSNHQSGLAIDIDDFQGWKPYLQKYGWDWYGWDDRVHFDYERGGRDIRQTSVVAFQKLWNENNLNDQIAEDGLWGPVTQDRLNRSPIKGFNKSIHNFRTLRLKQPYMQGKDVRKVQQALVEEGFDITVDGFYGPETERAVTEFQKENDLTVDGIVGTEVLSALGLYCQS